LRRKLVRWRDDNAKALINSEPVFPEGFHNRVRANWRMLLAIAEVAGDSWPTKAQEAASKAEAVVDTASVGTELLMAVRNVFDESGEHELSSATLVAKLTADPEGRWHEWKAGKPLTQKQLAGLLREYSITSETVHPRGGPDAKGYKRERFTDAWGRYLAPQQAPSGGNPDSEASKRPNADGSSTSRDFPSVLKDNPDASKKGNLSYSHAGLDAWTVQKAGNGAKGDSATNGGRVPNDFDAVAEELAERRGSNGPVYARVRIRTVTPPAISAGPDDDVLDIDRGWRQ
jgi:hypothetical protein